MKLIGIALVISLVISLFMIGGAMADTQQTTGASVTVNEFLSVTLSNDPVTFPNADPLERVNAGGSNGYPLIATIGAETNVGGISVKTKGAAEFCTNYPTCDTDKFAVSNMEWSDAAAGSYTSYTTSDATVCSGLSASGTCNIYHELTIPTGQEAGTYTTGITITATKA